MAGWSTTDKNTAITVSGTNNTVLTRDASAAANKIARYTTYYSTGKYYIEVTLGTTGTADDEAYGLANAATSLTASLGFGSSTHLGFYGEASNVGRFLLNSAQTNYTYATDLLTAGRVISLAVDFTNKLMWARVNGGNWNGSGTANPATGTGGFSISGMTAGPWTFAFALYDPSTVNTTNFGATAFTYTVPSGFAGPETAAPTAYTLTAATGSFAITGQTATLTYSPLTVTADNSLYTADSSLVTADGRVSKTLTAAAGSFAITGQTATLTRTRNLAAAAGSFAIAPKTATLTYATPNKVLGAATGSFAIAPKTANFLRGRVMPAAAGSFVITGQSASFIASRWSPVTTPAGVWTPAAVAGGVWTASATPTTIWS